MPWPHARGAPPVPNNQQHTRSAQSQRDNCGRTAVETPSVAADNTHGRPNRKGKNCGGPISGPSQWRSPLWQAAYLYCSRSRNGGAGMRCICSAVPYAINGRAALSGATDVADGLPRAPRQRPSALATGAAKAFLKQGLAFLTWFLILCFLRKSSSLHDSLQLRS